MGFFSELEDNLGKYIEGFFKEGFLKDKLGGDSLQPVEIAKKLAREMRAKIRVGLNEVYAPNRFEIGLSSGDYAVFEPLIDRLNHEMTEYVKLKAKEKDYTMLGLVSVTINEQQYLPKGQFAVESFFDEQIEDTKDQDELEDTLRFMPVRSRDLVSSLPVGLLEVAKGPLAGENFIISAQQMVLGRDEICDITIPDSSISRRHAIISRQGEQFLIQDCSSTNGTYVNDVRIPQKELKSGDKIKAGNTIFMFSIR